MRTLALSIGSVAVAAVLAAVAGAVEPTPGELSVQGGRGVVVLELRSSVVLGVLGAGAITVVDRTPRDRYIAVVTGRKLTQQRIGPSRVLYRGQGLRFRMLGGGYRVVIRGVGIALSAVGRGVVSLDGERRFPEEDAGVYSVDGVDCSVEPQSCTPLPDEPIRLRLGSPPETSGSTRMSEGP
jgi:hypothetical protein